MKNIYVGNLSFDATEDQVRSMFEAYGPVERVSIVTDRDTGQPRGFAFVEMTDDDAASKAMDALNGTNLGGRNLTVNEARPKADRPRGGGGGGGRGGGGGGRGRSGGGGGGGGWGR
jgi:RNA recognition motif-containing protein